MGYGRGGHSCEPLGLARRVLGDDYTLNIGHYHTLRGQLPTQTGKKRKLTQSAVEKIEGMSIFSEKMEKYQNEQRSRGTRQTRSSRGPAFPGMI
mgnify:CR=1 FL=1